MDWSRASAPTIEAFAEVVRPWGGNFTGGERSNLDPGGNYGFYPFCGSRIPRGAHLYGAGGKPKDKMTAAESEAYAEREAGLVKNGIIADEDVFVVDGVIKHINIYARER